MDFAVRSNGYAVKKIPSYIGADFLCHYSLLVDMAYNRLIDGLTQLQVQGIKVQDQSPSPTLFPKHPATKFEAILRDHVDI